MVEQEADLFVLVNDVGFIFWYIWRELFGKKINVESTSTPTEYKTLQLHNPLMQ